MPSEQFKKYYKYTVCVLALAVIGLICGFLLYMGISNRVKVGKVRDRVPVGEAFVDFSLVDTLGREVRLSDYAGKGQVAVLDFWASWCGPCIREMPSLKETYELYRDQGLIVIGVDLDQDPQAWKKTIREQDLPWIHVRPSAESKNVSYTYGADYIPQTILIDARGVIRESGLRGKDLRRRVATLLKETP